MSAERYIIQHERRLDELEELVRQLNQRSYAPVATTPGSGDSGGGGYYADPGATVVSAGGSATLTVMEIKASGDVEVGERTVLSRRNADTAPGLRIFLTRCRDGSYSIDNQDCPEGA